MTVQQLPNLTCHPFNKHVWQRRDVCWRRIVLDQITQIFTEALYRKDMALINIIRSKKEYQKIYPVILGKALFQISYSGRLNAAQEMMQDRRFSEVEPHMLGRAFCQTVVNGHTEIVNFFLASPCFDKIPTDGFLNSLSVAIVMAVEWNRQDMVEMFMRDPFHARFAQIKDGGMVMALCKAEQYGYESIAECIRKRLPDKRQLCSRLLNGLPKIKNCFDFVVRKINSMRRLRDRYAMLDGNMYV